MGRSIFLNSTGRNVARLPDPHFGTNDVGLMTFDELTNATAAIAVTNLTDRVTPRYQVTDTLGERTVLNTFGRSIDTRSIEGLCYESFCSPDDTESGFEGVMRFFDEHNASVRNTPVTITVGKSFARSCYLLEMTIGLADSTSRIWQFSAKLIVEPEREQNDARRPVIGVQDNGRLGFSGVASFNSRDAAFNSDQISSWSPASDSTNATPIDRRFILSSPLSRSSVNAAPLTSAAINRSGDPSNISTQAAGRVLSSPSSLNPFVIA